MKILFLTDGLFPFIIGGMQKHSTIVVKLLVEKGIHVHVVHCGGRNFSDTNLTELFDGIDMDFLENTFIKFPKLVRFPGHYLRENKAYSFRIYNEFESRLNEYDLVYAQGFTGSAFVQKKKQGSITIPIVVNLHGFEMFQYAANFKTKLQYNLLKKEARFNLRNADWVYSFGAKLNDLLKIIGVNRQKILLQSNGIMNKWLVQEPSTRLRRSFLFVGRDERRKGMPELKEVLKRLPDADFDFHFIGKIEIGQRMVKNNFYYHGEIRDENKIKEILDQCDCLVCPSYAEGMPTVILEAMARGLAIIATDVGAVSRLIEGNGILLEKPDVLKLKNAIETIKSLTEFELMVMKTRSLELVKEKFLWSKVIEAKIEDFKNIIGEKN